jgi:hypothetical protein
VLAAGASLKKTTFWDGCQKAEKAEITIRQPGNHGPIALDPWFSVAVFQQLCLFRTTIYFSNTYAMEIENHIIVVKTPG